MCTSLSPPPNILILASPFQVHYNNGVSLCATLGPTSKLHHLIFVILQAGRYYSNLYILNTEKLPLSQLQPKTLTHNTHTHVTIHFALPRYLPTSLLSISLLPYPLTTNLRTFYLSLISPNTTPHQWLKPTYYQ